MPQFDVDTFAPQLVWLAITFIALFLIMWRLALPQVASILETRRAHIDADLAEAARLREETAKAIADYEQALADAKTRAHNTAQHVRDEMSKVLQLQREEADQVINTKMDDAAQRIGKVHDAAVDHISEIATEVAQAVVAQVIGGATDSGEMRSAVNEALGK